LYETYGLSVSGASAVGPTVSASSRSTTRRFGNDREETR